MLKVLKYKSSLQACSFLSPGNGTHVDPPAAVERAHSDRARSGSKGPAWVSFHPSDYAASVSKKVGLLGWKRFVKMQRTRASFARDPGGLEMAGCSVTALRR